MKNFLFTKLFLGSTAILSWLFFISSAVANPSQTTNKQGSKPLVEYRCIDRNGHPTTLAYTSRGTIELIVWKEEYFAGSGYTPKRRCREVTSRFQQHSDAENLRYISTGIMNRYKIICVSDKSGNCKPKGLLITLKHNDNPEKVMRDLFNLSARKSGGGINLSARRVDGAITRVSDKDNYLKEMIDIDKFLAESPVIDHQADNNKPVITNPWENW